MILNRIFLCKHSSGYLHFVQWLLVILVMMSAPKDKKERAK
ncbi:hypothetical protein C427_0809 [Paraglaciecola psychrophila 170]|uniref:Uncharacterized protein n=1 Tax=Paraglaciecola psychrophila 170 TaxID=1129794 RepID=K7AHP0_9ALTE|nr:hypothetical protein C427_0809 [Paraglaciecola psychrophila 170]GAC40118.1 hypothetical protein GPSY_4515 [Paraglaciecola psychrophila 170]